MTINILYEDNHLLAVSKPAGMLSMGDQTGDLTARDNAANYLREKYHKPGNVYVGVIHRLDRPVSGVLLFARTSKAAGRLSDQFRRNIIQKKYVALVHGSPVTTQKLEHWVKKDRTNNTVTVVDAKTSGAQRCELQFSVDQQFGVQAINKPRNSSSEQITRVKVYPRTGRSHQIRVQLAAIGCPIIGDTKYGSKSRTGGRIMLHAAQLTIDHPTKRTSLTITAPLPKNFCADTITM